MSMDSTSDFIVDYTVNGNPVQTGESGRTSHEVETNVRRRLNRSAMVTSFSIDLIREVVYHWDGETGRYNVPSYRVPESFLRTISVRHR